MAYYVFKIKVIWLLIARQQYKILFSSVFHVKYITGQKQDKLHNSPPLSNNLHLWAFFKRNRIGRDLESHLLLVNQKIWIIKVREWPCYPCRKYIYQKTVPIDFCSMRVSSQIYVIQQNFKFLPVINCHCLNFLKKVDLWYFITSECDLHLAAQHIILSPVC